MASRVEVTVKGGRATVEFVGNIPNRAKAGAMLGMTQALGLAYVRCKELITAEDHTLADLARLKHPYGMKRPSQIHVPDEIIHVQSGYIAKGGKAVGNYEAGLKIEAPVGYSWGVYGRVYNDDPLDAWLQLGTVHMRARPYMKYVARKYGDQMGEIVANAVDAFIADRSHPSSGYMGRVLSKYPKLRGGSWE